MKIGILGPAPPFRGGISLFAFMLAKALSELGHEVIFYNFKSQYPRLLFPGKGQFDGTIKAEGFVNHRLLTPWLPASWFITAKAMRQAKLDLVIVSWFLPFFAPCYGWILRHVGVCQKLILAHNVSSHESWAFAKQLMLYAFKSANRIVVLSQATLNELRRTLPLNIARRGKLGFHPIYTCYKSQPTPQNSEPKLLFFGLIKPYKGLDVLLKAMPDVLKAIPSAKLIVAGEVYGDSNIYHKLITELGLADAVQTRFSYITDTEISQLFASASLCILPYKSASQSGVIATAYSFGVPVLATKVGGLGEYVAEGETGYLVAPNDPKPLAEAIIKHLQNRPDMRPAIATYTQRYSWAKLAELMVEP